MIAIESWEGGEWVSDCGGPYTIDELVEVYTEQDDVDALDAVYEIDQGAEVAVVGGGAAESFRFRRVS